MQLGQGWGWVVGAGMQPSREGRAPAVMKESDSPEPCGLGFLSCTMGDNATVSALLCMLQCGPEQQFTILEECQL